MKKKHKKTQLRIFHGPENIGGIGRYLADWQREKKNSRSDFIVYCDNTPFQNSHKNLHLEEKNGFTALFMKIKFFVQALNEYDLFHFYFGKSLLPLNLDLPFLRLCKKRIIMNYVGSDIRLTSVEKKRNPYYHLRLEAEKKQAPPELIKKIKIVWQSIWFDRCIAPRNLYAHANQLIPSGKIIRDIWTTNTIILPDAPPAFQTKKNPVILHAPTNPERKGTKYIIQAIEWLEENHFKFEFLYPKNLPHDELIEIIKNRADIVVDALLSGGYGNLAMEGMGYGKSVCGFILDEIRSLNPDLPVVHCTIETIKDKLAWLINNPEERLRISKAGWEFAKKHYDRNVICEQLWKLYLDIL